MFTMLKRTTVKDLAFIQAPSFLGAFVTAEAFYKFHSFALETLAFLATWFVLDALCTGLWALLRKGRGPQAPAA